MIAKDVADEYTKESVYKIAQDIVFGESNNKGSWIQILRFGRWNHPVYGPVEVNTKTFQDLIHNFKENVRGIDIAIDTEHKEDKGAVGWIKNLEQRGKTLWAFVDWTIKGVQLIGDEIYKYVSAEFSPKYEDPETRQKFENVLVATTVTNRPFIKHMAPIMLSEGFDFSELVEDGSVVLPEYYQFSDKEDREVEKKKRKIRREKEDDEEEDDDEDSKELEDPIKTLRLKRKGGKEMELNEVESGIDMTREDLQYLAQFSDIIESDDDSDDDYSYEFEEERYFGDIDVDINSDLVNYIFDEGMERYFGNIETELHEIYEFSDEVDGYGYDDDSDDGSYEFSEGSTQSMIDPRVEAEVMALSESLELERARNAQLQDTLKFSAVEGIVDSWIEDDAGNAKILPQQRDHAMHLLMELPPDQQRIFAEFVDNSPAVVRYGETGVPGNVEFVESGEELQMRARELYERYTRNGQTVKFSECLKTAYKEMNSY
jgi:predicted  nucleic acid-binding Zn-ribbon protein